MRADTRTRENGRAGRCGRRRISVHRAGELRLHRREDILPRRKDRAQDRRDKGGRKSVLLRDRQRRRGRREDDDAVQQRGAVRQGARAGGRGRDIPRGGGARPQVQQRPRRRRGGGTPRVERAELL